MFRPEDLFVPATPAFDSLEDEVRAVASGAKALSYSDHDELVSLATSAGLSVLRWLETDHRGRQAMLREWVKRRPSTSSCCYSEESHKYCAKEGWRQGLPEDGS